MITGRKYYFIFILKLVKMENPFKEPQKGCILCSVTVDYKNIQVSLAPAALQLVLHCVTLLDNKSECVQVK